MLWDAARFTVIFITLAAVIVNPTGFTTSTIRKAIPLITITTTPTPTILQNKHKQIEISKQEMMEIHLHKNCCHLSKKAVRKSQMEEEKINAGENAENVILKSVIEDVSARIENSSDSINNRELINLCRNYVQTVGTVDPHLYHEIAEASLNVLIKRRYAKYKTPSIDECAGRFLIETIKPFAARLPTQTWRSSVQTIRQQFSTPPAIAFL